MYTLLIKHPEGYVTMPEFETYARAIEIASSSFYCLPKVKIDLIHPAEDGDSRRKIEMLKYKDLI